MSSWPTDFVTPSNRILFSKNVGVMQNEQLLTDHICTNSLVSSERGCIFQLRWHQISTSSSCYGVVEIRRRLMVIWKGRSSFILHCFNEIIPGLFLTGRNFGLKVFDVGGRAFLVSQNNVSWLVSMDCRDRALQVAKWSFFKLLRFVRVCVDNVRGYRWLLHLVIRVYSFAWAVNHRQVLCRLINSGVQYIILKLLQHSLSVHLKI